MSWFLRSNRCPATVGKGVYSQLGHRGGLSPLMHSHTLIGGQSWHFGRQRYHPQGSCVKRGRVWETRNQGLCLIWKKASFMSNRTYLTLGFDSQPKNGQIVIMFYAFQDILAKYLNSHLPVIVETNPVPSAKVANAAFLAEDILFRSWKQITFHRNRASVLIGGAIKIGWSRTLVQSWHRLFFLYFAQPWVATGQAKRCYKGESDQAGSVEISDFCWYFWLICGRRIWYWRLAKRAK